jgi:hypothetical protein
LNTGRFGKVTDVTLGRCVRHKNHNRQLFAWREARIASLFGGLRKHGRSSSRSYPRSLPYGPWLWRWGRRAFLAYRDSQAERGIRDPAGHAGQGEQLREVKNRWRSIDLFGAEDVKYPDILSEAACERFLCLCRRFGKVVRDAV